MKLPEEIEKVVASDVSGYTHLETALRHIARLVAEDCAAIEDKLDDMSSYEGDCCRDAYEAGVDEGAAQAQEQIRRRYGLDESLPPRNAAVSGLVGREVPDVASALTSDADRRKYEKARKLSIEAEILNDLHEGERCDVCGVRSADNQAGDRVMDECEICGEQKPESQLRDCSVCGRLMCDDCERRGGMCVECDRGDD